MAKVPKNYRMNQEVLDKLELIIEAQNEVSPIPFNQTTMLEFLIKTEFENLGLGEKQQEKKQIN